LSVKSVPEGFHCITPYLMANGVASLIDFLKNAFGAVECLRHARPDGTVMHAQLKINDSFIMMAEPTGPFPAAPASLYLYLDDVDAVYANAIKAGAESVMPPSNQFYGDRMGGVKDLCGNTWWLATHIEDVSDDDMKARMGLAGKVCES